jgi:uncharacterized membrane protein YphA (DoxX/SURF4 family)
MTALILVGRILFSMIFLASGATGHLGQTEGTAGYAESRGVPNAKLLVQLSGVLIFAAGLGVALGIYLDLALLGIVIYLLITNVMVHHFWSDHDPMTKQSEMTQFMKNLALIGAALALFALTADGADMGWTLTDPLF